MKSFSSTKSNEITFNPENLGIWPKKKATTPKITLNLEGINKNGEISDQTPTPTRFIRKCEEVGLFQDLQNVNPFEEQFQEAVQLVKSGVEPIRLSLEPNEDTTLHTPHIFPQTEEVRSIYIAEDLHADFHVPVVTLDLPEPIKKGRKTKDSKEKIREMNRAAQIRCRKRRQQYYHQLEEENQKLKAENRRLSNENNILKASLVQLNKKNGAPEGPIVVQLMPAPPRPAQEVPASVLPLPIRPAPSKECPTFVTK